MKNLNKFVRFIHIYGVKRALIKTFGRLRLNFPVILFLNPFCIKKNKDIGVIGCGQFAYSTIAFFITKKFGARFKFCLDIDDKKSMSFAKAFMVPVSLQAKDIQESILKSVKLVYIASNHASHASYACYLIEKGVDVYIEKPIAVDKEQFSLLKNAYKENNTNMYVGYNRPFSSAISDLKKHMREHVFTLSCIVIGHFIDKDHWYRDPQEGTRVCGNLGHWIDLAVHLLLHRRRVHYSLKITITYSDENASDDNISLCLVSDFGDLINIVLTSREEPFEGINETIIFQQQHLFAKIDDFRRAEFQQGSKKTKKKYKPKDVGHKNAIMQPFSKNQRNLNEVFLSTDLMLHIMDMVKNKTTHSIYQFRDIL
ncbi:Gfo/Idh/MocA family protein [Legionella israelensis]|uniref:Gfo/Idh/MocA family protein n=1 Tax=Legionella israelensis TaxID=454 RepID=UPI00163D93DD|nr:Gfo/Idh/MocA family oxidoreductase [Legionella israelensis]